MPAWLAQWSALVIAVILTIAFGGVVLSIIVPKIRNALFYQAVGTLVERATAQKREREEAARQKESQDQQRRDRQAQVAKEVDELADVLTILAANYSMGSVGVGKADNLANVRRANVALSLLGREGPEAAKGTIDRIGTALATEEVFSQSWANAQIDVINRAIRNGPIGG
jgi:hypothetical protein